MSNNQNIFVSIPPELPKEVQDYLKLIQTRIDQLLSKYGWMLQMEPVNITWNPDIEAYETSFPYNPLFIEWIKKNIPTNKRSMDFDRSRKPQYKWLFEQVTLEQIILPMMKGMFSGNKFKILTKTEVDEYNKGFVAPSIKVDKFALGTEFLNMLTSAGITIPENYATLSTQEIKKYYRRAAMFYHPDRNPENASKMSRLNEIWTTIFEPKQQESLV